MLKTILYISGKPGLYKMISQGKNMLIVESISETKKRLPVYSHDKITALSDIAIYTDEEEVPLKNVLTSIKEKENGEQITTDLKKITPDQLRAYFAEVLPAFDRERVYPTDIKKMLNWYNILIANGITDFESEDEEAEAEEVEAEEVEVKEETPSEDKK